MTVSQLSPQHPAEHMQIGVWGSQRHDHSARPRQQGDVPDHLLVAGLLDILGHETILGVLPAVEQGELGLLLSLEGQGAACLASVLAGVHKHHGLVALL